MPFYLAYFSQSLLLFQERTLLTLLKHHLTQTNPDTTMPLPDHVSISRHCLCPRYIACLPSYPALSSISGSGDSEPAHNRRQAEIPRDSSDLPTARFVPRFLVNVSLHLHAISLLSLVQPPASISFFSCRPSPKAICYQRCPTRHTAAASPKMKWPYLKKKFRCCRFCSPCLLMRRVGSNSVVVVVAR